MSSANALAKALTAAGITPPYVVIGHSFGGYSARAFVGTHLDQVKGLVLLDTTDPAAGGINGYTDGYQLSAWRAELSMYVLTGVSDDFWQLPLDEQAAANSVTRWPSFLNTVVDELNAADLSAAEILPLDLSHVPLLVVCVPDSTGHVADQKNIASISLESNYAEQAGYHMGMLLDHDQAQQTAQKIQDFVNSL